MEDNVEKMKTNGLTRELTGDTVETCELYISWSSMIKHTD